MSSWLEDIPSSVERVASFLGGGGGAFLRGGPPLNVDLSGRALKALAVGTVPEEFKSDDRKPVSSLQQQIHFHEIVKLKKNQKMLSGLGFFYTNQEISDDKNIDDVKKH